MLIAIDYDRTWTEDPTLWRNFIAEARKRGHRFVLVTGRKAWSDDMERGELPSPVVLPIVYSGDEFKQRAAARAGFKVDVWIDDLPGMIQPPCLLDSSQSL